MLIHSASQLLTISGGPQRGMELGCLGIIPDGAVLVQGGLIAAVGTSAELLDAYPTEDRLDAGGRVVMPGFVDPHTHAVWAGDRAAEFDLRLQGKTYLEILAAGGGILSTVRATRQASLQQLVDETRPRLHSMFAHGTTTAEVKTGYGLELDSELRQLEAILALDAEAANGAALPALAATFLGAHAVPPEYKSAPDDYTDLICKEMLPVVKNWWQRQVSTSLNRQPFGELRAGSSTFPLPFVDVFCETGAFSLAQSRRILEAARSFGFPLKIHADEFDHLGGSTLAASLGAVSADHLVKTSLLSIANLAASPTVAVALPCTPFGLAETQYTPAQELLKAGGLLAIATDLNPGTAWCESMQFAIALACRYMKLTPAQAIAAATINAAAAIGRAGQVGSLEVGKQADLLILAVDDYRHLGYRFGANLVAQVIRSGQRFMVAR